MLTGRTWSTQRDRHIWWISPIYRGSSSALLLPSLLAQMLPAPLMPLLLLRLRLLGRTPEVQLSADGVDVQVVPASCRRRGRWRIWGPPASRSSPAAARSSPSPPSWPGGRRRSPLGWATPGGDTGERHPHQIDGAEPGMKKRGRYT